MLIVKCVSTQRLGSVAGGAGGVTWWTCWGRSEWFAQWRLLPSAPAEPGTAWGRNSASHQSHLKEGEREKKTSSSKIMGIKTWQLISLVTVLWHEQTVWPTTACCFGTTQRSNFESEHKQSLGMYSCLSANTQLYFTYLILTALNQTIELLEISSTSLLVFLSHGHVLLWKAIFSSQCWALGSNIFKFSITEHKFVSCWNNISRCPNCLYGNTTGKILTVVDDLSY